MADGADLQSAQMSLVAMRPRIAFGVPPSGLDKICRTYFFGLAPVPPVDAQSTMADLVHMLEGLSLSELSQVEQLMLSIATRLDCDEGVSVARNVVRQKPQAG